MPKKNWYALNGGTKCALRVTSGAGDLAPFSIIEPVLVWAIYAHNNAAVPAVVNEFVIKQGTATGAAVANIMVIVDQSTTALIFPKPVHFPAGLFLDKATGGESVVVSVLFEEADPA